MNTRNIVSAAVLIAVIGGIYYFSRNASAPIAPAEENNTTSGMRAEGNAIVVMEQRPDNMVTASSVFLAAPGFVVVHEDSGGNAGAIIGASALLPAGESNNVKVALSRASKEGEKLYAMLHFDSDGSGSFTQMDLPVESIIGGPIEGWFEVSSSASVNVPVSI